MNWAIVAGTRDTMTKIAVAAALVAVSSPVDGSPAPRQRLGTPLSLSALELQGAHRTGRPRMCAHADRSRVLKVARITRVRPLLRRRNAPPTGPLDPSCAMNPADAACAGSRLRPGSSAAGGHCASARRIPAGRHCASADRSSRRQSWRLHRSRRRPPIDGAPAASSAPTAHGRCRHRAGARVHLRLAAVDAEHAPQRDEPHQRRDQIRRHQHRQFDRLAERRAEAVQHEQRTAGDGQPEREDEQTVN